MAPLSFRRCAAKHLNGARPSHTRWKHLLQLLVMTLVQVYLFVCLSSSTLFFNLHFSPLSFMSRFWVQRRSSRAAVRVCSVIEHQRAPLASSRNILEPASAVATQKKRFKLGFLYKGWRKCAGILIVMFHFFNFFFKFKAKDIYEALWKSLRLSDLTFEC